jgi:hypothetical protein
MFVLPIATSAVPASIAARERKAIIRAFREAGATHRDNAKTLREVGLPNSLLVEVMKLRHVLVEVEGKRFYLDVEREEAVSRTRGAIAAIMLLVALVVLFVVWRKGVL